MNMIYLFFNNKWKKLIYLLIILCISLIACSLFERQPASASFILKGLPPTIYRDQTGQNEGYLMGNGTASNSSRGLDLDSTYIEALSLYITGPGMPDQWV